MPRSLLLALVAVAAAFSPPAAYITTCRRARSSSTPSDRSFVTPSRATLYCCSAPTTSDETVESKPTDADGAPHDASEMPVAVEAESNAPPTSCAFCGASEAYPGCNGEGRVMGGLAAIELFNWWPIKVRCNSAHAWAHLSCPALQNIHEAVCKTARAKELYAYRPCPTAAENGKRYERSGQTLDEIVCEPQGEV
eukprot:6211164-Pleurochrysis_carterae.AAC.1